MKKLICVLMSIVLVFNLTITCNAYSQNTNNNYYLSIVKIDFYKSDYSNGNSGIGFFIKDNTILTCYHVINGFLDNMDFIDVTIFYYDANNTLKHTVYSNNQLMYFDKTTDLALIKMNDNLINSNIKPLQFDNNENFLGKYVSFNKNLIQKNINYVKQESIVIVDNQNQHSNSYEFIGDISSGSSGSPILNSNGDVISIVYSGVVKNGNDNLILGLNMVEIKSFMDKYYQSMITKVWIDLNYLVNILTSLFIH